MARARVDVDVRIQRPINLGKVQRKIAEDLVQILEDGYARQIGETAVEMANRPIQYWKRWRKPKFSAKIQTQWYSNGECTIGITLIASGSNSCLENYRRIDIGTRMHRIVPKKAKVLIIRAYEPKTRPAVIFNLPAHEGVEAVRYSRTTRFLLDPGMERWKTYTGSPAQLVRGYKGKYYTDRKWLRTKGKRGKHYRFAKVVKSAHINPRYFLSDVTDATIKASLRLLHELVGSFRRYARLRDSIKFSSHMSRNVVKRSRKK